MKVEQLFIFYHESSLPLNSAPMMGEAYTRNDEARISAENLALKYTNRNDATEIKVVKITDSELDSPGKIALDPDKRTGVYVVMHISGSTPYIQADTLAAYLKGSGFARIDKLALLCCTAASTNGSSNSDKSQLVLLGEALGKQGLEPKLAGWTKFVTVLSPKLYEINTNVKKGEVRTDKPEFLGRKVVRNGSNKAVFAKGSEQKKFFWMKEGKAVSLSPADWHDA